MHIADFLFPHCSKILLGVCLSHYRFWVISTLHLKLSIGRVYVLKYQWCLLWSLWLWNVCRWQLTHAIVSFTLCLPFPSQPTLEFFSFTCFVLCFLSWWPITVLFSSRACPVHHKTYSGPEFLFFMLLPLQCQSTCDVRNECCVWTADLFVYVLYILCILFEFFAGCLVSHVTWGQCSLLLLYSI